MARTNGSADDASESTLEAIIQAENVDEVTVEANFRQYSGWLLYAVTALAVGYSAFHLFTLNIAPLETWTFRLIHIAGALVLGYLMYAAHRLEEWSAPSMPQCVIQWLGIALLAPMAYVLYQVVQAHLTLAGPAMRIDPVIETWHYGWPLVATTVAALILSWLQRPTGRAVSAPDSVLMLSAIAVGAYLIIVFAGPIRTTTGTSFAPVGISFSAVVGSLLILELTRRVAGIALVVIAALFLGYTFAGPYLPGFLGYPGLSIQRFFSQIYTDAGILGPTTAVSSTYIILFIIFAAFLQASRVGDYFVNFAFAVAGKARGGPAKVAIFASGLMGMINGTSAGNVVSTGSLTIPLMQRVGYDRKTSGAIEAAASTGGQIMPPIMGAGAFIMAEITGIPYQEIALAAVIPAILYFVSIYFMVDTEAVRRGIQGVPSEQLPTFRGMARQVYLFVPIVILIWALFSGYSVIRAGTLATVSAVVVSWLSPHRMGVRSIVHALELASKMSVQIIVVCACAGIIVGVISLTGVGARFSSLLLGIAEASQLLALFFAMCISILLGMGMPTTAAYAVAASVVAPGLVQLGIPMLTAHFFVFYFAVVSAITPPVALASYAAAGISGARALETSVASFKIGLVAFIVPFMFFYNSALLLDGTAFEIGTALVTALIGVYLLSGAVLGHFMRATAPLWLRAGLGATALLMMAGGARSDWVGIGLIGALILVNRLRLARMPDAA